MAYNGSGVFNLYTPGNPVVTGTVISSTWANNTLSDMATGLSTAITKNGQTTTTTSIPFSQGLSAGTNFVVDASGNIAVTTNKFTVTAASGNALIAGTLTYGGVTLSAAVTGTGKMVLDTSPTLVTPLLGTPTSGTLTNCTGLPVSSGISGLGTGVATALAAGVTGSGNIVLVTSPTFATSVIGSATMAVFNSASTTVNAFGAATTLNIGNSGGTNTILGATTFSQGMNGVLGGGTPAALNATTGGFSSTVTITKVNTGLAIVSTATNSGYASATNTVGTAYWGQEGTGGNKSFTGTTDNAAVWGSATNVPAEVLVNTTKAASFSASGLTTVGYVIPSTDNSVTCGGASNRWSVVYAGTGTINTSDAREKTEVSAMSPAEIEASKQLAKEIGVYKWLSAVSEKGDAARKHVGFTVQRAMEIMQANGLEPMAYGFICYDKWDDEFVEHPATDDTPAWTEQTQKAGDRYAFRYDELNMFIARGFEARLSALEAK